jgi:hypothetical protein
MTDGAHVQSPVTVPLSAGPVDRPRGRVAAVYDYFDSLETAGRVLTAVAAVLLWPILLFGFDIRISR